MLYSVNRGRMVTKLPHEREFTRWRANISKADYQAVCDTLNGMIDGDEVHTAGWMPGHDWTGTVFEPLYHACGDNTTAAGLFFGLIVYDLMMRREEIWGFGRYMNGDVPIQSMTYFRLRNA